MISAVQLRPGTPADAGAVAALATYVFLDTYTHQGLRDDLAREVFGGYSQDQFDARLRDPDRTFHLAHAEGHLVGFAEVAKGRACPVAAVTATTELVRLYVHPRFHRRAVGATLLRQAEGQGPLWLTAWSENANALAFYAARGYRRLGTTPYVFEDQAYENIVLAKAQAPA